MRVALTVDLEQDCPPFLHSYRGAEEGMPRLLALLRDEGVPATVFATGEVGRRYPDLVREIVAAGHELGCHGDTHRAFDEMDDAEAAREIERASAVLRSFAPRGGDPRSPGRSGVRSFRAPYLRLPPRHLALLAANGYAIDSSEGAYKTRARPRVERTDPGGSATALTRIPASVTSSVLRLPRLLRRLAFLPLRSPVVLFVHPWELVDLRRAPIRWDCRFRTGDAALASLAQVARDLRVHGATFHTLSAVLEERRGEDARDAAHDRAGEAAHG